MPDARVRVSPEELAELQAVASASGLSVSAHIRRALGLGARPSSLAHIGALDLAGQVSDHEERLARLEELVIELGLSA